MKTLDAQNHYEVLEVSRLARADEIERAYKMATATWSDGSLALYSLFDQRDAAVVRDRILHAYRTLSDEGARRAYDLDAFDGLPEPEPRDEARADNAAESALASDAFDEMEAALDSTLEDGVEQIEEFDGQTLRRLRMQRGIEIADIAEITKVSGTYLKCIEDEDLEALPAPVYLRGFLIAYARAVGLDADRVVSTYMPRLESTPQGKSRGRLLGRR